MKKIFLIPLISFYALTLLGQSDIDKYIAEAQGYLKEKNYKDAQIALQQAISEINSMVGKDVLAALPPMLNEFKANPDDEVVNTGGMGMMGGGFTISRNYYPPNNNEMSFKVNIVANSPMIASVNMMINNPMMLGANPDAGKSIKVGNRRGLLKANNKDKTYELMLPLINSLITINGNMIKDEATFMQLVTKLDTEKIAKVLGE
jgi:hypothetical protein